MYVPEVIETLICKVILFLSLKNSTATNIWASKQIYRMHQMQYNNHLREIYCILSITVEAILIQGGKRREFRVQLILLDFQYNFA